jgi:hypothetical protein
MKGGWPDTIIRGNLNSIEKCRACQTSGADSDREIANLAIAHVQFRPVMVLVEKLKRLC